MNTRLGIKLITRLESSGEHLVVNLDLESMKMCLISGGLAIIHIVLINICTPIRPRHVARIDRESFRVGAELRRMNAEYTRYVLSIKGV